MQSDQSRSILPCDWTYLNFSCCDIGTIRILLCDSANHDPFHHAFVPSQFFLPCNSTNQDQFSHPMDQRGPRRHTFGPIRMWDCTKSGSSLPYIGPIKILLVMSWTTSSCRAIRLIRIRILHRCSPEIGGLRAKVHNPCRYEVHSHILFF
jgi:hypothetical protein